MKKLLSILLVILILALVAAPAYALENEETNAIYGVAESTQVVEETATDDEIIFKDAVSDFYTYFLESGFADWINEWIVVCVDFAMIAIGALLDETIIFSRGGVIE